MPLDYSVSDRADATNGVSHDAPRPPQRVIIDLTDLIGHLAAGGGVSGIPRVVFEFANAALTLERDRNLDIVIGFFDQGRSKYFQLMRPSTDDPNGRPLDWLLSNPIFRRGYPRPINLLKFQSKYADRPLRRHWHTTVAKCRLAYGVSSNGFFVRMSDMQSSRRCISARATSCSCWVAAGWQPRSSIISNLCRMPGS